MESRTATRALFIALSEDAGVAASQARERARQALLARVQRDWRGVCCVDYFLAAWAL